MAENTPFKLLQVPPFIKGPGTASNILYYNPSSKRVTYAAPPTLQIASSTTLGGVKVGTGLTIDPVTGVLSATPYNLPIASATDLGGVKVGTGLSIDPVTGVLSATGGGGGSSRFGVSGEDDAATGARFFDFTNNDFTLDNINDLTFYAYSGGFDIYSQMFLSGTSTFITHYKYDGTIDNEAVIIAYEGSGSSYPVLAALRVADYLSHKSNKIEVYADKIIIGDRLSTSDAATTDIQLKRIANATTAYQLYYNPTTGSVTYG